MNAVGVISIAPELIIRCPPVLLTGKGDRNTFLDIFVLDDIGPSGWLELPLVALDIVVT